MKTDLYTKTLLTVIALALVILVFQNFNVVPTVTASPSPNLSNISSNASTGTIDVNIVSVNGYALFGKALQVEVANTPEVKINSGYGGLEVKVTNTPEVKINSGYGGLEVKVTNHSDFK